MVTITATETRGELEECIAHVNTEAKRCLYGTPRWDELHDTLDRLLRMWETIDA